jgi:hypothetical protein
VAFTEVAVSAAIVRATENLCTLVNSRGSRLPCTLSHMKKTTLMYSLLCLLAAPGLAAAQEVGALVNNQLSGLTRATAMSSVAIALLQLQ